MRQPIQETKSKKTAIMIQPSVAEAARKVAYMQHDSLNNLINTLLKNHAAEHSDLIAEYDRIFGKDDVK